jgi:hypothetical protein
VGDRITATQYQMDTQTDELKQAKASAHSLRRKFNLGLPFSDLRQPCFITSVLSGLTLLPELVLGVRRYQKRTKPLPKLKYNSL